jgi:hypothetical protein
MKLFFLLLLTAATFNSSQSIGQSTHVMVSRPARVEGIGALRFRDEDGGIINGLEAKVSLRWNSTNTGAQHLQRCNEEAKYSSGEYYIEVNTVPVRRYVVDVSGNATTEVMIPPPGLVRIVGDKVQGLVSLWMPQGDKFIQFDQLKLADNKEGSQLVLCRGTYEAHWTGADKNEAITRFRIESDELTVVVLKAGAGLASPIMEKRKGIQWNGGR